MNIYYCTTPGREITATVTAADRFAARVAAFRQGLAEGVSIRKRDGKLEPLAPEHITRIRKVATTP